MSQSVFAATTCRNPISPLRAGVSAVVSELKALPKSPGTEEIFMPGEIENTRRAERKAGGIHMPESVYRELQALADAYGVTMNIEK